MALPARKLDHDPRRLRWHNPLPGWIVESAEYAGLTAGPRQTLQAIADSCDPPDAQGNLTGAFGRLWQAAGCSKRSFWRHVRQLDLSGMICTLGHGGPHGMRCLNVTNTYGVPGRRGSLDHRKCRRTALQMLPSAEDGKHRPQVLQPGDQATFWPRADLTPRCRSAARDTTVVSRCHQGSDTMTLPWCQTDTLPSDIPSPEPDPLSKNHDHGGSKSRPRGKKFPHVRREDLVDMKRLWHLFERLTEEGWIEHTGDDWLWTAGAAVHALRVGRKPEALFRSTVANCRERRLYVPAKDEEEGARRIKQAFEQEERGCIA